MKHWPLPDCDVTPHRPQILSTHGEGRVILLHLPEGEALQEHQVHERAWVLLVTGAARVDTPAGESLDVQAGGLIEFDPAERHTVTAQADTRLLLLLAPWPGVGHPSGG